MSEWISVKDRLPENDDSVLVCAFTGADRQVVFEAHYWPYPTNAYGDQQGAWQNCDHDGPYQLDSTTITHWMPMPAPPEAA